MTRADDAADAAERLRLALAYAANCGSKYGARLGIRLDDAADCLGLAMFGSAWKTAAPMYSESERIAAAEKTRREIKHLQQAHRMSMESIRSIDSLSEMNLLLATTPETLEQYEKARRDFLSSPLDPPSSPPPPSLPQVTHPELTASERAAIAEECSDGRNPDAAAGYLRLVAVASTLRDRLRQGSLTARV